jgi:hypothetical protein
MVAKFGTLFKQISREMKRMEIIAAVLQSFMELCCLQRAANLEHKGEDRRPQTELVGTFGEKNSC